MRNRPNVGEVWSVENRGHHHLVYILKAFDRLLRIAFVCDNPPDTAFLTKKDVWINDHMVVKTWHCISIPTVWFKDRILVVPKKLRNKIFETGINETLPVADKMEFRRAELLKANPFSIAALFAVMDEMEMEMETSS